MPGAAGTSKYNDPYDEGAGDVVDIGGRSPATEHDPGHAAPAAAAVAATQGDAPGVIAAGPAPAGDDDASGEVGVTTAAAGSAASPTAGDQTTPFASGNTSKGESPANVTSCDAADAHSGTRCSLSATRSVVLIDEAKRDSPELYAPPPCGGGAADASASASASASVSPVNGTMASVDASLGAGSQTPSSLRVGGGTGKKKKSVGIDDSLTTTAPSPPPEAAMGSRSSDDGKGSHESMTCEPLAPRTRTVREITIEGRTFQGYIVGQNYNRKLNILKTKYCEVLPDGTTRRVVVREQPEHKYSGSPDVCHGLWLMCCLCCED